MALGTIGKIAARVTENPPMPECMERIKNIYFSFVTVLGKRVRCEQLRLQCKSSEELCQSRVLQKLVAVGMTGVSTALC